MTSTQQASENRLTQRELKAVKRIVASSRGKLTRMTPKLDKLRQLLEESRNGALGGKKLQTAETLVTNLADLHSQLSVLLTTVTAKPEPEVQAGAV